jgi:molybdopterin-guanine dinucleotide biosynthesis protein A
MTGAAIVLCGGRSSRMGRPKPLLPWRGGPMIAHVVGVLREVVDEVVVVNSAELDLPPLDARIVVDREPGLGPLAGIREGLWAIAAERAFVTAADAPFLAAQTVRDLLGRGPAVAPVSDGHVQTLCAVYPRRGAVIADALLAAGRMRPLFLLEAVGYEQVGDAELGLAPARGLNTPASYLDAVRELEPDATATLELMGQARRLRGVASFEVPIGTLAEVLAHAEPGLGLCAGDALTASYLVSLNGRQFVRDTRVPVGPSEAVIVMDAMAGG